MRSSNGMGTITKRKGVTKPYLVYGKAVNIDGVMKRPYLGSFRTRKEAELRRIEYYQNPEIKVNELSFKDVFEELKKSMRWQKLTKSGQDNYKAAYKYCSALYGMAFKNIRTKQLQEVINEMHAKNLSKSSLSKATTLMSLMYRYALENDIVNKNYASFIILPDYEEKEKRQLTSEEIKAIKELAYDGNKTAKWIYYLILSGWRIGEMLELTAKDYDERLNCFKGGKKTKAGKNRIVPVCSSVQWVIDEQLKENGETVFCMPDGKPMTTDYFRKFMFDRFLESAKIDTELTPHNCRHTFSSLLKKKGADDFYIRSLMGHSQKGITNRVYTHEDYEGLKKTIELLSDI